MSFVTTIREGNIGLILRQVCCLLETRLITQYSYPKRDYLIDRKLIFNLLNCVSKNL